MNSAVESRSLQSSRPYTCNRCPTKCVIVDTSLFHAKSSVCLVLNCQQFGGLTLMSRIGPIDVFYSDRVQTILESSYSALFFF